MFEKYDDEATQCDVAVVPCARLRLRDRRLPGAPRGPVSSARQHRGDRVRDRGVRGEREQRAGAATTAGPEVVYRDGRWRRVPFEFDRAWFEFPDPVGRRQMSRYGSGEVITVPHHVQTQSVITLITSTSLCPYPVLLPVFPMIRPVVGLVRRTPARAILGMIAAALGRIALPHRCQNPPGDTRSVARRSPLHGRRRSARDVRIDRRRGRERRQLSRGDRSDSRAGCVVARGGFGRRGRALPRRRHSNRTRSSTRSASESVKWSV